MLENFPSINSNLVPYLHPDKLSEYFKHATKLKITSKSDKKMMQTFIKSWSEISRSEYGKLTKDEKDKIVIWYLRSVGLIGGSTDDGKLYMVTKYGFILGALCMGYFEGKLKEV